MQFPLVLHEEACVRIAQRYDRRTEGLSKAKVVICAIQEVGEGGKRVRASDLPWVRDGRGVMEIAGAETNGVSTALHRQIVHHLVETIETARWRPGASAERGNTGDGDRRPHRIVRFGCQIAVDELAAGFIH